ncbi:MAG: hypothetical protein OES18_25365 [Deltaproteobacteria bacterium]|nr:hypothetical protein [Deltaproteobacteria bacterium]
MYNLYASPDVSRIACCDSGYDRPSLRAVGSTLRGVVPYGTESSRKPGVLGCRILRRTVQVRLGSNPAVPRDDCPARGASACAARGTAIFAVSRRQFVKHPGQDKTG